MNLHEDKRFYAVKELEILDSEKDSDFDDLVNLAAIIFDLPISTITIIDSDRLWFKASVGLLIKETPREMSFCEFAIQQIEPFIISDAKKDPRFANNPLVNSKPNIVFYAGFPLRNSEGLAIGTFCIMGNKPKNLSAKQIKIFKFFANQAKKLLDLRLERNKYRDLIHEKDQVNSQLEEIKQRWQFAIEGSGDGVWDWDVQTNKTFFSHKWKEMLGYEDTEITNTYESWISLIHKDDIPVLIQGLNDHLSKKTDELVLELRMFCKDNNYKWILSRGMVVEFDYSGLPKRMVGTHTDITARKQSEEMIWKQANFDLLTGLPNRRLFFDRLKEVIKKAKRKKRKFAVMFIDLDGFKEVNDRFGHKVGDNLLIQVVQRVGNCLRECDTFARLGGDEFIIILTAVEKIEAIEFVANKVLEVINKDFQLGSNKVNISASIGVSTYPESTTDSDTLISLADTAMYKAKAQGKNRWFLSP